MNLVVCLGLLLVTGESASLQARLAKGFELFQVAEASQSKAQRAAAARMIAGTFFQESVVTDRKTLSILKDDFVKWLSAQRRLSPEALQDLYDVFELELEEVKERDSYIKRGWVRGLAFSGVAFLPLNFVAARPLRKLGAYSKLKLKTCKRSLSKLALRAGSYMLARHPRVSFLLISTPPLTFASDKFYFSSYENWDAAEDFVKGEILPRIDEALSQH